MVNPDIVSGWDQENYSLGYISLRAHEYEMDLLNDIGRSQPDQSYMNVINSNIRKELINFTNFLFDLNPGSYLENYKSIFMQDKKTLSENIHANL